MATRVLVQCRAQTIPGDPGDRLETMANLICNFTYKRPLDKDQDRIQSSGQWRFGNDRVYVLVDNGELDAQDISTTFYRWNGTEFLPMQLNPIVTGFLQKYPFDNTKAAAPRGHTDEEFKAAFGTESFNEVIIARIRQRRKWGQKLMASEEAFLKDHPELASDL